MGRMMLPRAVATTGVLLALASPAAAQQVTKIDSGDTIVVDGVGKVRLIGIRSVDESPLGVGPNQQPPARQDPPGPTSLPPTAIGGAMKLKPNRPSKDFLTTLLLVGAVGLLVPWVVRRGLKPLDAIGEHAAALGVESLRRAFPSAQTPRELAPITSRLNDLLARLAAAFDRESRFTASAAHELRTPIAEIRAVAEVALHWPEFDQSQRALADIVEVTGRTERLIEMLMKIGHARAGRIVTEAQPVNIGTLVEETMRSLLTTASERDLRITVKPQDTDRYAHVDPTLARAIVANLLANAVLHTPPRGNVTVDVACLDEAICLTIVNECSEISKEDIPKICEPFWTNSTSRSNRHHGLGLALVREYARILDAPLSFSLTEGGMFCATVTFAIDETSISSKAQSPMLREAALHPVRTGS
jgi:signal transduction histidine kinase